MLEGLVLLSAVTVKVAGVMRSVPGAKLIAPAWSPLIEWLPIGNPRYRILKNADMTACPPDYVIDEVSVEEATAALDNLVADYPAGAAT